MKASDKRVAVLGGGIGGLASAHSLLNAGFTPIVLAASDRLGGLGASRVDLSTTAQTYPRVTAWSTSIGLTRDTVNALAQDLS